jgi:hypothetical protein
MHGFTFSIMLITTHILLITKDATCNPNFNVPYKITMDTAYNHNCNMSYKIQCMMKQC